MKRFKQILTLLVVSLFIGVFGCGGDDEGGGGGARGSISGTVTKGAVDNGLVNALNIAPDGQRGPTPIVQGLTDSSGNYFLSIGGATGLMELNLNSGNFVDEVTGSLLDLAGRNPLRTCIDPLNSGETRSNVAITPYTTLGCILADFKILDGNSASSAIASANQEMSSQHIQVSGVNLINLNITNIIPNVSLSNPIDFTDPSTQYGLIILGLSQQAFDIGSANPGFSNFTVLDLLEALELDITDGNFDGQVYGSSIELVSGSGVNLSPDALKADLTNSITNFLSSNVLNPLPSTTTTTTTLVPTTTLGSTSTTTTISGSTTTTSATTTSPTTSTTSATTTLPTTSTTMTSTTTSTTTTTTSTTTSTTTTTTSTTTSTTTTTTSTTTSTTTTTTSTTTSTTTTTTSTTTSTTTTTTSTTTSTTTTTTSTTTSTTTTTTTTTTSTTSTT